MIWVILTLSLLELILVDKKNIEITRNSTVKELKILRGKNMDGRHLRLSISFMLYFLYISV